MNNTDIVIAYILPDMESRLHERILEVLRMRMIQTTDDIKKATVIIHSTQQMPGPGMTLAELAEKIVEQTRSEIFQLWEQFDRSFIPPAVNEQPIITKKQHKNTVPKCTKQYNQIKQRQKQVFFNRTKCK